MQTPISQNLRLNTTTIISVVRKEKDMLTLLFGLLMLVLGVLELHLTKQAVKTYERYDQSHATPFKLWGVSYGYYIGAALILLSLRPIITGISSII
ncbi:hypothetical protein EFL67_05380 [Weissella confusa]|nr:hypothetical protein [Weissella confusa]